MFGILYGLTCLCAKGIKSAKDAYENSIERWKENGSDTYFDAKGKMRYKFNNHLVIYKINPATGDDCLYDIKTGEYIKVIHKHVDIESFWEERKRESDRIFKELKELLEQF